MDWQSRVPELARRMLRLAGCEAAYEIIVQENDVLAVSITGNTLSVQAPDLNGAGRALYLAACAIRDGQPVKIRLQKRHIRSCGPMIDMSRGGVMTVDALKNMIDRQAAMGLNMLMLYTEDTFTVPEYPYFGYLRGRYTEAEIRELDDYADSAGIELVPCIQTLAHLEQFLQWNDSRKMVDNDQVLLVDEPEVYKFLRAVLTAVSKCFRSKRVHIGMDEAHGIGLGRYYMLHGAADRFSLLNRHLNQVVKICEELSLRPIMWSDMFYRLGSKKNDYYDTEARVPAEVAAQIPNVALCYWDYYHREEAIYDGMMAAHRAIGRDIAFAGGIWTWSGFLPHVKLTEEVVYPAVKCCLRNGIDTVLVTMWGDDGAETDCRLALNQLAVYSEYCWLGLDATPEDCRLMGERVSGLPQSAYAAMGEFYPDDTDCRPGKALIYTDPLYPLLEGMCEWDRYDAGLVRGIEELRRYPEDPRCVYACLAMTIAHKKLQWIRSLRPAYIRGNRAEVRRLAEEDIPALLQLYRDFLNVWRDQWEGSRKRNGWETPCARLGAVMARLEDVQHILLLWADGKTETIDELEETPLPAGRFGGRQTFNTAVFPQYR